MYPPESCLPRENRPLKTSPRIPCGPHANTIRQAIFPELCEALQQPSFCELDASQGIPSSTTVDPITRKIRKRGGAMGAIVTEPRGRAKGNGRLVREPGEPGV